MCAVRVSDSGCVCVCIRLSATGLCIFQPDDGFILIITVILPFTVTELDSPV